MRPAAGIGWTRESCEWKQGRRTCENVILVDAMRPLPPIPSFGVDQSSVWRLGDEGSSAVSNIDKIIDIDILGTEAMHS